MNVIEDLIISTEFQVLDLINEIATNSSRTEKERLVEQLASGDIGKFVLRWAYDPFITYGLTPVRTKGEGKLEFREGTVSALLNDLAERKLTGNAAQREVAEVMMSMSAVAAELLWLVLSKDLKCGISTTTINKVMPGLVPTFSVMRAHKFEEKRIKAWPVMVEPKYDGYRFSFICRDGHGNFFSRSGKPQPAAEHLIEPMIEAALTTASNTVLPAMQELFPGAGLRSDLNFMADGEMIMPGDFNANGALRRKDAQAEGAKFHIFDIMSFNDFDAVGSVGKPYLERRKLVDEFVRHAESTEITKSERYFANSHEEIYDFYAKFQVRGLEGAMVKIPEGLYDKRKSYGWLKIKAENSEDLPIVGAFPGEPNTKYENCLGGLIVDRNGVQVRVGGGFSDSERIEIWELFMRDEARMASPPVYPEEFELHGRLIEVLYHEVIESSGSLRHPRFRRFRDDKAGEVEEKQLEAA